MPETRLRQAPLQSLKMQLTEREILRILDANLDRAREGLRVVEELARFVLEDKSLQKRTKSLRHKLASLFVSFGAERSTARSAPRPLQGAGRELLIDIGRDALSDVGKDFSTSREATRATILDLVQANFARVQESVRVLEEFTKFFPGTLASRLKSLRFEIYDLEKDYIRAATRALNIRLLRRIGLYPIIDRETIGNLEPAKVATHVLVPGVRIVQYRDKVSSTAEICQVCADLRKVTLRKGVIFIVNDSVDIAQATDADGVHLGQDDMPVATARRLLGSRKIIGKSTHSFSQARRAAKEDVDYLAVGPLFSTPTKSDNPPVGVELVAKVRAMTDKPIVAIGGIDRQNLGQVLDAGADGAAVISAVLKAKSPRASAESLVRICRNRLGKRG